VVVLPADQIAFIRPGFFLDGVVKNQRAFSGLHFPHHRLDLPQQVLGRVALSLLSRQSCSAGNPVYNSSSEFFMRVG
jgi:hypothetical protein